MESASAEAMESASAEAMESASRLLEWWWADSSRAVVPSGRLTPEPWAASTFAPRAWRAAT
jgi:hypothetical protein